MRRPPIHVVVERLITLIEVDSPPRHVSRLLEDTYIALGVGEIEAQEHADMVQSAALVRLEKVQSERLSDGRTTTWEFNPSDGSHLQGACFVVDGVDAPDLADAKRRRKQLWKSLQVISDLDPLDFEALCQIVLEKMGVSDIELTPRRADQGIDFFGRLTARSELAEIPGYPPVLDRLRMWVIGQAKQYIRSQVATFDLRELVGSVELARAKAYGLNQDRYPSLDIRVADPVISLFFTSGQLSREALILARKSGVIAVDGELLAHVLAWAGVGFENQQFDADLFKQEVKKVRQRSA